jgi:chromosome segregation ATPase
MFNFQTFNKDKSKRQQTLNELLGDGNGILAGCDNEPGASDFREKLSSLERQWTSVNKQAEDKRLSVNGLLDAWQSYLEQSKKLAQLLDELQKFIDQNPVNDCAVDDLRPLLDEYKVYFIFIFVT